MRRVRYSVAASLDGFIADSEGGYDWIVMDPDINFSEIMDEFDTLLLGRNTYDMTRSQPGPAMPGMTSYVISSTLKQEDCPDVIVSNDARAIVTELKQSPGKDIWLFGGGILFSSLLNQNLVDSVEIAVIPVLLGSGLPLLPPPARVTTLKLVEQRTFEKTGTVSLRYDVA